MKSIGTENLSKAVFVILFLSILAQPEVKIWAQTKSHNPDWIQPQNENSPAVWGLHDGIVFSLWPTAVGSIQQGSTGGPRGLLRIGYNFKGVSYLINFIAIEPVVDEKMEFSEISPSRVDNKIGKLIWASADKESGKFYPSAITRGTITHPDPKHPEVEQLSLYLFMENFFNGAHPYLKVTIRSDHPEEIGLQIFNQEDSAPMDRCALTATMGNYNRLRLLYLKDRVVDSRKLYQGFDGIHFIEKKGYPADQLLKDKNGDFIAIAAANESFSELSSWPQKPSYLAGHYWRYRPFFKVTQYWRKEHANFDPSLHVRVNGRAKYWSGGSKNLDDYIAVPGGVAFENFEMREKYYPGETFYFGITRKSPDEMDINLPYSISFID